MHVDNPIKHRHDKRLYAFSLSFDVGLNKHQAFKNQRSTDNSAVKFDLILGLTGARLRNIQRVFFANRPCR